MLKCNYLLLLHMSTITIRVEEELKEKMKGIKVNWSEFIRKAIRRKIEQEERREAAERLLRDLKGRKHAVPKGFINETIRRMREAR